MAMLKDDYEENTIDAEIKALKNKSFNLGENKLYNISFPHLSCQFWNEYVMTLLKDSFIFYENIIDAEIEMDMWNFSHVSTGFTI